MSTNLTVFSDVRAVPNTFMDSGTGQDGKDQSGRYLDCTLTVAGGGKRNICTGLIVGSTNDVSGLAQIKCRLRGGNSVVTLPLVLGLIHPLNLSKIYPSDGNGVFLMY